MSHKEANPPLAWKSEPADAYAELVQRLERAVASICPKWLSDRREDLTQVALMRVMEVSNRESGEGNHRFSSSYLWKVAYSALVDEIRRLRRRQEVPLEAPERNDDIAIDRSGPEIDFARREISEGIRTCLGHLVPDRRRAVALYLQGHSVPEAARILEWDLKRTENLVYRGLGDLRKCLSSMGLEP